MPTIIPAILEETDRGYFEKVSRVIKIPGVERIQVDFGDGKFIPTKLLDVMEIDSLNPAFVWEAHLMVKEPKDFLDYQICGFNKIIVHFEAYKLSTQLKIALQTIKSHGMEPCICINPGTSIDVLKEFEDEIKHFQIMGVHPGKQGQEFLEEMLYKIADFRKLCPNAIIEVDGGVNETNIKAIANAGADLIVAGSAVVKMADMAMAYEKLAAEMNRN